MEINEIKKIIEALLFVSDKPLLTREIKAVIKEELSENDKVEDILKQMQEEYVQLNRAFELKFVADGWTFSTKPEYSAWIKKMLKEKTVLKLSPSAMEVLAIIAYKQPITRGEIDNIRGVDSGGVIDTLTDRKFIKIVGKKESLGRPMLYGTTQEFLRHFGLSHLSELPVIESAETVLPNHNEDKVPELPFDGDNSQQNTEADENTVPSAEAETDKVVSGSAVLQSDTEQHTAENTDKMPENNTEETAPEQIQAEDAAEQSVPVPPAEPEQVQNQSEEN